MAIDWIQIPIVQKDMHERWESFSLGHMQAAKKAEVGFKSPAVAGENVYGYDPVKDRVYNTINTYSLVGLVCPDKRDANFIFDGQLNVFGGGDNDPLGIVIAYTKMPNGDIHTLTVMRTLFGIQNANNEFYLRSPMTITKDLLTVAPKVIAESFGVLKFHNGRIVTADSPYVPFEEHNTGGSWRVVAPNGVHVRVVREQDIITVESSQINETELIPESKLTIDLSSDPDLAIFRGRSQYGFCSFSQDQVYWSGRVDHPKLATPFWLSDVHAMYGTEGKMSDAAEAGGVWTRDPVDLKDVFDNWYRFSRGSRSTESLRLQHGFSDTAKVSDSDAFTYDEATNRIGNPLNTDSLVGFISPEVYTDYTLDVTITSLSNWQVDPVGLVLAHVTDPDGTKHTLTIMRCSYAPDYPTMPWLSHDAPMQVAVDYNTHAQVNIAKGYFGLRYNGGKVPTAEDPYMEHPGGSNGSTDWGFDKFPNGVRIAVTRNKDTFIISTSQYDETNLHPGAVLTIDLNSHPSLARFKAACPYGFCTVSQDLTSWDATYRPGGWRRPFMLSEFGKFNDYIKQTRGPFNINDQVDGSGSSKYGAAVYEPTNTPLDAIVPLRGFLPATEDYLFSKDVFVYGHHFKPEELVALGLEPTEGLCIVRPSIASVGFVTGSAGEVGYYIFHKSQPFSKRVVMKTFTDLEMISGAGAQFKLPQPEEDMILVPYIKSAGPVSNINVTIRNV